MKKETIKLTRKNFNGLLLFWGILLLGILGGLAKQNWAENVYVIISFICMIIFIPVPLLKSKIKPIKHFIATYFINVLFCISMGWWWVGSYWLIITISTGYGMHFYIESMKNVVEGGKP